MDIELVDGVFERTCNYVQMNCAVMGLVIKRLAKLDLHPGGLLHDIEKALKGSLKETNQDWAIRATTAELYQCVEESRTALKEN